MTTTRELPLKKDIHGNYYTHSIIYKWRFVTLLIGCAGLFGAYYFWRYPDEDPESSAMAVWILLFLGIIYLGIGLWSCYIRYTITDKDFCKRIFLPRRVSFQELRECSSGHEPVKSPGEMIYTFQTNGRPLTINFGTLIHGESLATLLWARIHSLSESEISSPIFKDDIENNHALMRGVLYVFIDFAFIFIPLLFMMLALSGFPEWLTIQFYQNAPGGAGILLLHITFWRNFALILCSVLGLLLMLLMFFFTRQKKEKALAAQEKTSTSDYTVNRTARNWNAIRIGGFLLCAYLIYIVLSSEHTLAHMQDAYTDLTLYTQGQVQTMTVSLSYPDEQYGETYPGPLGRLEDIVSYELAGYPTDDDFHVISYEYVYFHCPTDIVNEQMVHESDNLLVYQVSYLPTTQTVISMEVFPNSYPRP